MFGPILIPVDGSPCGDQAAEAGLALAGRLRAAVHFVHVRNTSSQPLYGEGERQWRELEGGGLVLLQYWRQVSSARGLRVMTHSIEGTHVARAIVQVARSISCGLIVMGTHCGGRLRRLLLRSTAEAVVSLAPTPVATLRYQEAAFLSRFERFERILAPVDGGVLGLRVLEWVRGLAQALSAEVMVLHVAASVERGRSVLDEALERLAYSRSRGLVEVAEKVPVGDLIGRIANGYGDLVVMGTQGRLGWKRLRMPSTTQQVACASVVPVIQMRPAVALHPSPLRTSLS